MEETMPTQRQPAQTRKITAILFLLFGVFFSALSPSSVPTVRAQELSKDIAANLANNNPDELSTASLQSFQLLSTNQGWLLFDNELYWTDDGGKRWNNVTPLNLDQWVISSVSFLDTKNGWLTLTQSDQYGFSSFALARTSNAGKNWQVKPLSLFKQGDISSLTAAVYL